MGESSKPAKLQACSVFHLRFQKNSADVCVLMSPAARQQSKPFLLTEKKGKGLTGQGEWRLFNDLIENSGEKELWFGG